MIAAHSGGAVAALTPHLANTIVMKAPMRHRPGAATLRTTYYARRRRRRGHAPEPRRTAGRVVSRWVYEEYPAKAVLLGPVGLRIPVPGVVGEVLVMASSV